MDNDYNKDSKLQNQAFEIKEKAWKDYNRKKGTNFEYIVDNDNDARSIAEILNGKMLCFDLIPKENKLMMEVESKGDKVIINIYLEKNELYTKHKR